MFFVIMIKIVPFLIFLLGFFILFFIDKPYIASPCFIVSVVMLLERIWPSLNEKGSDKPM